MSNQQMPENLYHYTDPQGAKGIRKEGIINQSTRGGGDAAFGDGTYMTSLPPSTDKQTLTWNNYDDGSTFRKTQETKTTRYVEIPTKDLPGVQKVQNHQNRDIYHYPGSVVLPEDTKIAKTPKQKNK